MTIQIIVFVEAGQVCEIKDFHMDCLSGRRGKILWESEKTVLLFIILTNERQNIQTKHLWAWLS